MRIDAHQHYWSIARTDYGWLTPETGVLYRDYQPDELKPLLEEHGLDASIVVQAAPTTEETEYMLSLADREPAIAGVVGWLDFEGDSFDRDYRRFRANPKFVGVRPMIQDLPSEWLLRERVVERFRLLAAERFPVDLQANPRHLPFIADLLQQVPDLQAVIDHLAKPMMDRGELEPWASQMSAIANYPGVMCKLSGMVPDKHDPAWSEAVIRPFAAHAIRVFGPKRVMFGSDWPVCLNAATYAQVRELASSLLGEGLTEEAKQDVYGGNAARFYRLG
ncbi:amidohydrolase family protein [Paenibacillus sacheonensis]|uniref:Amidohydrolase family protein n=1 Tax=Paenibacillus sacheonensis TaxID=742054 RepID=A0A7X4YJD7_9BACL|nr:amidohydrolase family protein [Paenibacillus sacheonensis]MBM7564217.1 L-fuconolactonase [Paenibacillus sacheonensis]NBC67460.1 amidohydrolase family protein [Paenibacillus sacheonensis]